MLQYVKRLLWDESAFVGLFRSVLAMIGLAVETGKFPVPEDYQWVGLLGVGAAMLMRSSVKYNGKPQPPK